MPKPSTKFCAKKIKSSSDRWRKVSVSLQSETGLHTRPAAALVKIARRFPAEIRIYKGKRGADAKSILHLLSLGAERGHVLTIAARGLQAEAALQALKKAIENGDE